MQLDPVEVGLQSLVENCVLERWGKKLSKVDLNEAYLQMLVLHIMQNGIKQPIAFASRTQNSYAQTEQEALRIIFGVRKFHKYPFRRKFLLKDHRPLTIIFRTHRSIPALVACRMQRCAPLLSAHTNEIKYRKSELHGSADGLSRLPLQTVKKDPP